MKDVLFWGGLGLRLREYADDVPNPMAPISSRPILWHLMKYYAHYQYKEFYTPLDKTSREFDVEIRKKPQAVPGVAGRLTPWPSWLDRTDFA